MSAKAMEYYRELKRDTEESIAAMLANTKEIEVLVQKNNLILLRLQKQGISFDGLPSKNFNVLVSARELLDQIGREALS